MKTYTVVYRTGGTENFKWHRTLPTTSLEEAKEQRSALIRAGYAANAPEDYDKSVAIGLPETY